MGWRVSTSHQIVGFLIILLASLYIIFPGRLYSVDWFFAAGIILLLIIWFLNFFSHSWIIDRRKNFSIKLFWSALFIRLIGMSILLAISYKTWNLFYTVGARDEMVYFRVASEGVTIWKEFDFKEAYLHILESYKSDISDIGFSTFLMFPIRVFGQIPLVLKSFLCIIGSFGVLRGYKLAKLLLDEKAAKLAGIFLLLYPISWFYSAIILKESLMVLLMIEALLAIVSMQNKITLGLAIRSMVFIVLLFFFRSAISILMLLVLGFSFFIKSKKKNLFVSSILAIGVILIYIYFLKSTGRFDEYYDQYTNIDEFTQERLSYMESINPFVAVVGSPAFAALSYITPFPSVVKVPNAGGLPHSEYYYHIAGNLFWIVLAFFSFYGLYYSIRYKRQEMAVLAAFVVGYQFVLLKAMMFTSVRFSYPAKPFLLILAAYGFYQLKNRKWYPVYLATVLVLIIGWNYVRLQGRS